MTDRQCGHTTVVVAGVGPGGMRMPVKPKCIRPRGHGGKHSNGKYQWGESGD